jgi:hypothetical protein
VSPVSVVSPPGIEPGIARKPAATDIALAEIKATLARERPVCTVYARSSSDHTVQIYAGLHALHAAGTLRLRQRFGAGELARRLGPLPRQEAFTARTLNGVFVDVAGAGLVFFDVRDSAEYYGDVVGRVALYAKRSYRRAEHGAAAKNIVPLGLNYLVYPERAPAAELTRSLMQLDRSSLSVTHLLVSLARLLPAVPPVLGTPTVGSLSPAMDHEMPPKAIFLARTWNAVAGADEREIEALNDFRAGCIRALRQALGPRFLGGFARTEHACRRYPDCVVDPSLSTLRRDYLRRLRSYPVCIATTGLFGSIGWKFAEYVALSRAIAAEPLRYELPGPIKAGENYLVFTKPEECVAVVARLLADADLRERMMARNGSYYVEHGAPDAVVGRVLHAALAAA